MLFRTLVRTVAYGGTAFIAGCGGLTPYAGDEDVCELDVTEASYGLGPFDAVDLGSPLLDDGAEVLVQQGEITDLSEHHWYVIQTEDNVIADVELGRNGYHFQAKFTQGAEGYRMTVYRNDYIPSAAECADDDGTTEYSDYYVDTEHIGGVDPQACAGPDVEGMNECEDMGALYFIEVYRVDAEDDCGVYQLSVANGPVDLVREPEE